MTLPLGRFDEGFIGEAGAIVSINERWSLQPFYSFSDTHKHGLNSFGIVSSVDVLSCLRSMLGMNIRIVKN